MGLNKTRAAILQLAEKEMAERALKVRNAAVIAAPVDTGRLQQSIGITRIGEAHYRVGTNEKNVPDYYVVTNVEYAPYVEYGTRLMSARPFMRPALEAARGRS